MVFLQEKLVFFCLILPCILSLTPCTNIPPFLSRLRDGVDVTKLDLQPLNLVGNDGFRYPVFDFTCEFKVTKRLNGILYNIPDQVWSIVNIPSGLLDTQFELHKNSHSFKKSMSRKIDVDLFGGVFSASSSFMKMQSYLNRMSKYIEEINAHTSGYKVNMMPDWALNYGRVAKMYIDRFLSPKLDKNSLSKYMKFIKMFGTHYFNQGKFGGILRLLLATDTKYFEKNTEVKAEKEAKGLFKKLLGFGVKSSTSTKTVDTSFMNYTRKYVRYYGGQTNLLDSEGIKGWQPTVLNDPWLYGGGLSEISGMISDESKRKSMKRAVQIYTDLAYLKELLREISGRFRQGNSDKIAGVLFKHQMQIKRLLQKSMPNHSEVVKLGRMMSSMPDWFQNAKFCFQWNAEKDKKYQCDSGKEPHRCAKVNHMTDAYTDGTGYSKGGCNMQWGIVAVGYEDWFKNVKICFKWRAKNEKYAQDCGKGKAGSYCAKVNSFTSNYTDDTNMLTNIYANGCYMQWMLSVPPNAPLWIQTSKMCMWYSAKRVTTNRNYNGGDGCYFSGHKRVPICAYANQYTNEYLDNTTGYYLYCQLQWGIIVN